MRIIDVNHLGRQHVIGCWDLDGVLIDPGPESSLPTLIEALGEREPEAVLLTHVHLDHSAAVGSMVERWPGLTIYVHERGVPHLVDPSRLLKSAGMVFGERMDELWGRIVPVPSENVRPLYGGEAIFGLRVYYTPGHARHHVSYLHEESGTFFVGDVAGCRIPGSDVVLPPTPPPDIDVELWEQSMALVAEQDPVRLALTHFGSISDPSEHLGLARDRLRFEAERARELPEKEYRDDLGARLLAEVEMSALASLSQAVPVEYQWSGLDRYWRLRADRAVRAGGGA